MTDDDTMALLARVRWLETEVQRLIERAAQAEADRDALAAEVGAWRTQKMRNNPNTMEKVIVFTNKSGALTRAKEAK